MIRASHTRAPSRCNSRLLGTSSTRTREKTTPPEGVRRLAQACVQHQRLFRKTDVGAVKKREHIEEQEEGRSRQPACEPLRQGKLARPGRPSRHASAAGALGMGEHDTRWAYQQRGAEKSNVQEGRTAKYAEYANGKPVGSLYSAPFFGVWRGRGSSLRTVASTNRAPVSFLALYAGTHTLRQSFSSRLGRLARVRTFRREHDTPVGRGLNSRFIPPPVPRSSPGHGGG